MWPFTTIRNLKAELALVKAKNDYLYARIDRIMTHNADDTIRLINVQGKLRGDLLAETEIRFWLSKNEVDEVLGWYATMFEGDDMDITIDGVQWVNNHV